MGAQSFEADRYAKKRIDAQSLDKRRKTEETRNQKALRRLVTEEAKSLKRGANDIAEVEFRNPHENELITQAKRRKGVIILERNASIPAAIGKLGKQKRSIYEEKIKALAQILDTYGILDKIPKARQESLLNAIVRLFAEKGNE